METARSGLNEALRAIEQKSESERAVELIRLRTNRRLPLVDGNEAQRFEER